MAKANSANDELLGLIAQAAEMEDHTDVSSGGGDYTPPAEGTAYARFIEYVELGEQKQKPWQGKPKKDAPMVRIGFELLSKKNIRTIQVEGKDVEITDKIYLTIPKLMSERAKFYKLFEKMRYGREDIKHMAQMLGEGFIVKVVHNHKKNDAGKIERTYASIIDKDGSFLVTGPFKEDLENEKTVRVKVPDAKATIRGFLFDLPTKKTWDSLFIDGDRTFKDENGKEQTKSKNWIQETILKATNFEGSPLEALLEGSDAIPDLDELAEDEEEIEELDEEELEEELDEEEAEEEVEEEEAEEEELEEEEDELEEEEEPAPKKKAAKAPAKKTAAPKKSVKNVGAKASTTKKPAATSAAAKTASPSKKAAPAKKTKAKSDDPLAALGLLED